MQGTLRLVGGPAPGTIDPAPGAVYAFTSADLAGAAVAETTAASDGTFTLRLAAGTYYLAATSPDFTLDPAPATPPCAGDAPATVTAGSVSHIDISCQMK